MIIRSCKWENKIMEHRDFKKNKGKDLIVMFRKKTKRQKKNKKSCKKRLIPTCAEIS